jgi:DNA-binding CsgD family transcriptional regulator
VTAPARPLLYPRQVAVLREIANGRSNTETAAVLGISIHTVEMQMSRIRVRLGTTGRAHAVAVALRLGLLTADDVTVPEALYGPESPAAAPVPPEPRMRAESPSHARTARQETPPCPN